jgi:hypothetical protein
VDLRTYILTRRISKNDIPVMILVFEFRVIIYRPRSSGSNIAVRCLPSESPVQGLMCFVRAFPSNDILPVLQPARRMLKRWRCFSCASLAQQFLPHPPITSKLGSNIDISALSLTFVTFFHDHKTSCISSRALCCCLYWQRSVWFTGENFLTSCAFILHMFTYIYETNRGLAWK